MRPHKSAVWTWNITLRLIKGTRDVSYGSPKVHDDGGKCSHVGFESHLAAKPKGTAVTRWYASCFCGTPICRGLENRGCLVRERTEAIASLYVRVVMPGRITACSSKCEKRISGKHANSPLEKVSLTPSRKVLQAKHTSDDVDRPCVLRSDAVLDLTGNCAGLNSSEIFPAPALADECKIFSPL